MSNRIAGLDLADVEQQLSKHFRDFLDNEIRMKQVRNAFHQDGYFHFKDFSFLPGEMWEELHTEVHGLLDEYSAGHEATVLFIHDPHRKVHMIPQAQIAEGAAVVPALYHSESLRHFLSCIANEELASCPDSGQYLISRLNHPDDTHDWHWGDYPYTLVWIIEAPEGPEGGDVLQCVPYSNGNKDDLHVWEYSLGNPGKACHHLRGDVYFLKSGTTLHHLVPIQRNATRIILSTSWLVAAAGEAMFCG
ncbi:hypothetical protein NHG95_04245 [Pseudomonas corrugata]|uniref:Fe2OG dioxygenase domain-containing protein n=1 Tax=Pseudomonas corrugata TaxID=47879 RepID=A0A3M3E8Q7_9PSED|nr:hypothetical protein [Pseudomonas corrugata]MDU9024814.1 hypothetical protein [Pseudomonas corrugata]MDU9032352.1 hypothetical protein [Pseudomonas corrugata]QTH14292.1 hypothetical protein C4C32_27805 [Pseudomonas corrugata]RMM45066.1 hypothetical protein ALQ77_01591 [Pseudomonas corrugata]SDV08879.1 hypothetical protein SAMN04490183_4631 [Pseudomonas corrugata]